MGVTAALHQSIVDAAQEAIEAHARRGGLATENYECSAYNVIVSMLGATWMVLVYAKARPIGAPKIVAHIVNYDTNGQCMPYARSCNDEHAEEIMTALTYVAQGEWD